MPKQEHPFSRQMYELSENGLIRVFKDNQEGFFRANGRWVSGQIRTADPLLCLWIAQKGRNAPPRGEEAPSSTDEVTRG